LDQKTFPSDLRALSPIGATLTFNAAPRLCFPLQSSTLARDKSMFRAIPDHDYLPDFAWFNEG
jgi:hypothetical protein